MINPVFIITTENDENVRDVTIVQEGEDYKDIFTCECIVWGAEPTMETFNEGVIHLEDGISIWITGVIEE